MLVSEISCVVDHAKLPNSHCSRCWVHLLLEEKKNERQAFRPLEGRRCDEIQFE